MVNEILIILIIMLYAINYSMLKKKIKFVEYNNFSIGELNNIITELSLSMNNQALELFTNNRSILKSIKYQFHNKWGIKLIVEKLEADKKKALLQVISENQIKYINDSLIEIDLSSNIDKTVEVIKILLNSLYNPDDTPNLSCIFLKRSVLVK